MATLKDVARAAGVSIDTASRVLGGRNKEVWPGARARAERIRAIAGQLGFRADAAARATRTGRRDQVGFLLRNDAEVPPTIYEIMQGVHVRLQRGGVNLVLVRVDDLLDEGGHRALHERLLDNVVTIGAVPDAIRDHVVAQWPRAVWVEGPTWLPERCLRRDETAAGAMAATALVRGGARRLVWIGPEPAAANHYSDSERFTGATAAATAAGLTLERAAADPFRPSPEGEAQLDRQLAAGGTGVLAASYMHATWLAHRCASRGLTAPRDFTLAACDDDGNAAAIWPDLARMANPRLRLGELAAEMLLADADAPQPSLRLTGTWMPGITAGAST